MQNSGETENELRPFLQRHDRPILERQRHGRLLLIAISGSGGCHAFSPSAHRSSPTSWITAINRAAARTLKTPAQRTGCPYLRASTYCASPNAANVATTKTPGIERAGA